MTPLRWYADGLHFSCLPECGGQCCRRPGEVAVSAEEAAVIEFHIGRPVGPGRLGKRADGACEFLWDTGRCGIWGIRPTQCRTFPFWPSVIEGRENWITAMHGCPGIGVGQHHTRAEVERIAGEQADYDAAEGIIERTVA